MFTYIVNPVTNKKVLSNSAIGKKIIENYRNILDEIQSGGDVNVDLTGEITDVKLSCSGSWKKNIFQNYTQHMYTFLNLVN